VSARPPSNRFPWLKVALVAGALVVGAGIGIGVAIAQGSGSSGTNLRTAPSDPGITWPAGARHAPDFALRDQSGSPISLRSLRGRPVILAFIDPLCRNLCPLEAKVLNDVPARLPASARPAIVAVSVNPWGQAPSNLRLDAEKWRLAPEWRWALGGYAPLAKVWRNADDKLVQFGNELNRIIGGVTGPAKGPSGLFSRTQTIRGLWESSSAIVFRAATSDGKGYYWRGATYEIRSPPRSSGPSVTAPGCWRGGGRQSVPVTSSRARWSPGSRRRWRCSARRPSARWPR